MKTLVGKKVDIIDRESFYFGEWGTILLEDGEDYHIAIADGKDSVPVFCRNQFRVKRK